MKRKFNFKMLAVLVSVILVLGAVVGGTLAYLVTSTGPVTNTFEAGHVGCNVTVSDNKYTVAPDSETNTTVYLRAAVVANWVNEDGAVYWQNPSSISVTTETKLRNKSEWVLNVADGYYYYQDEVSVGEHVNAFSVAATGNNPGEDYTLQIQVLGEAIQSKPGNNAVTWDNDGMN